MTESMSGESRTRGRSGRTASRRSAGLPVPGAPTSAAAGARLGRPRTSASSGSRRAPARVVGLRTPAGETTAPTRLFTSVDLPRRSSLPRPSRSARPSAAAAAGGSRLLDRRARRGRDALPLRRAARVRGRSDQGGTQPLQSLDCGSGAVALMPRCYPAPRLDTRGAGSRKSAATATRPSRCRRAARAPPLRGRPRLKTRSPVPRRSGRRREIVSAPAQRYGVGAGDERGLCARRSRCSADSRVDRRSPPGA